MTKLWTIAQHPLLRRRAEVRKTFACGRILEGEASVAINSGETHKHFRQCLATHALNRVTPYTLDRSYRCQMISLFSPLNTEMQNEQFIIAIRNRIRIFGHTYEAGDNST